MTNKIDLKYELMRKRLAFWETLAYLKRLNNRIKFIKKYLEKNKK